MGGGNSKEKRDVTFKGKKEIRKPTRPIRAGGKSGKGDLEGEEGRSRTGSGDHEAAEVLFLPQKSNRGRRRVRGATRALDQAPRRKRPDSCR